MDDVIDKKLYEMDRHKFIILRTNDIGSIRKEGAFVELGVLKEDILNAVYADEVEVKVSAK